MIFFSVGNPFKQICAALGKMIGFVTDGAPAMIGTNNGAAEKLKKKTK
jgi:hypothetical protein